LKHFSTLCTALLFFATQINAIDYSKEIKKEFDETATTIVGKFEKNSYTLSKDFEQCNNAIIPLLCYKKVLADIEAEQTKNSKALRDCFLATIGIYTIKTITISIASALLPQRGTNTVSDTMNATQTPVTLSLSALTVDQCALYFLASNVREKLSVIR
jgi:hypothetical protein